MIQGEEWLSEETREKAIEKIDNMKIFACYSEDRYDYSDINFSGTDIVDIYSAFKSYYLEALKKDVNQPAEKDMFKLSSTTDANACYYPSENAMCIFSGIIEGDLELGDGYEENLRGIGYLIGHEITHAFDPNGAKFDKNGNYADWWKEEEYTVFEERSQKVVDYLDKIIPYNKDAIDTARAVIETAL